MSHFLISCPNKKAIWTSVLTHLFPTFDFSVKDILAMLYRLQSPFAFGSYLHKPYTVAVASILWNIWFAYWQKIIHSVPFQPESIIKKPLSQISILLTSSTLEYFSPLPTFCRQLYHLLHISLRTLN
jgi:hypothetical protein